MYQVLLLSFGAIDANGGLDVSGGDGLVASSAKISDLTDNRIVIAGASGELVDTSKVTFDGTTLNKLEMLLLLEMFLLQEH